ncbi:YcxB family protein [Methylobacterium sp. WL30]|uniref:YcxB family protein n=1 Tax=unclassified Methylobacterium TaxID=2615210 RepID=UPI0011CAFADC|nr:MULTISPECIES: YcxB family protein [unclassified Methylobacterium]TXN38460.1 YcxB family protein [Methylobacterium sp. WL93]TXN44919.1 YcxB family protein [Methylobacterium sp. WL119]TXN62666.1 YcxB family protein [Methylobacterium sp. WL30]
MPSLTYHPLREDVLAGGRLHHLSLLTSQRTALVLIVYGVIVFGAFILLDAPADVAFVFAIGASLFLIVMLALRHLVVPWLIVRRQFQEQRSLHQPYTITWSERGYAARSETISSNLPWDHYVQWREDVRVILLYQSAGSYQFVPKHILSTDAQEFIRARLRAVGVRQARRFFA